MCEKVKCRKFFGLNSIMVIEILDSDASENPAAIRLSQKIGLAATKKVKKIMRCGRNTQFYVTMNTHFTHRLYRNSPTLDESPGAARMLRSTGVTANNK